MTRHLLNLLTALSWLLCVTVCVLWVRSYELTDQVIWQRADSVWAMNTARGYVVVVQLNRGGARAQPDNRGLRYARLQPYSPPRYAVAYGDVEPGDRFVSREFGDAGWYAVVNRSGVRSATGVAPLWPAALATAILPLRWTVRRIRSALRVRRRDRAGLCPQCGYDLRATPGRCPECGTASATDEAQIDTARILE